MAIREQLNGSSVAGIGAAAVLFGVSIAMFAYYHYHYGSGSHGDPHYEYYSDDDGQSYFTDSAFKFPPFDHNGKTANAALVFDDGEKRFVAYLLRFTPEGQKELQDAYTNPPDGKDGSRAALALMGSLPMRNNEEMKKVGDGDWEPAWKIGRPTVRAADGTAAFMIHP
jgi:hypothetical protein